MYQVDSLNGQEVFNICGVNVSLDDPPMCPFWDSFGNFSYLVVGGIDSNILTSPTAPAALGLSISFAFIAVILLLNVIITVINQSWNDVISDGLRVFWSERARYLEVSLGHNMNDMWKKIRTRKKLESSWDVTGAIVLITSVLAGIIWFLYGLITFGVF